MNQIDSIKSLDMTTIEAKLQRVSSVFVGIPIVRANNSYPYSHFSLTDFVPPLQPQLVEDMADLLIYFGDFQEVDVIVSEADRGGGPLAHAVAVRLCLPYTLANWYPAGVVGELKVSASPVWAGSNLTFFLNGIQNGQKVVLVDDLLSSGKTAEALLSAVKQGGAETVQALFVGEKVNQGGRSLLQAAHNVPIISLVKFVASGDITTAIP